MKKISELLGKFSAIFQTGLLARQQAGEVIKKHAKINLEPAQIEIKDGIAYLKGISPAARNEIFLKRSEIISELGAILGPRAPKELR